MLSRRFSLLAATLVSLNLVLWFASPGLALRRAVILQLFGPNMVRAQVFVKSGVQWNLDRGVITSVTPSQLTLREASGHIQVIPLSPATKVLTRLGAHLAPTALAPRWRVLVTWPANGAATSVDVERIPSGHGKKDVGPSAAGLALRRAVILQLFGPNMVRAQVYEKNGVEWNLDRGVITSVTPSQVTLREASGHIQVIPLSPATKVLTRPGARLAPTALAPRWRVLVTWPANGAATSVDVERIPSGHGKKGLGPSAAPASSLS